MSAANLYGIGVGTASTASFASTPYVTTRAPASTDINGPNGPWKIGQLWVNTSSNTAYLLTSLTTSAGTVSATWTVDAGGSISLSTLTGGSGGAISPSGGNINLLGTSNQITTTGSGSTITWSLPSAITAPGSLTTTTSLAATTTVTAGTDITSTAGNIAASSGNVSASGTVTAGTGVTATTGGVTATAGDITATAGNVIINGAAKQLRVHGGAVTDFIGQATLSSGTVTVANTNIAATDKIFPSRHGTNSSTALGVFDYSINPATSFTITALKPADATTETGDTSIVDYFIVRQV